MKIDDLEIGETYELEGVDPQTLTRKTARVIVLKVDWRQCTAMSDICLPTITVHPVAGAPESSAFRLTCVSAESMRKI